MTPYTSNARVKAIVIEVVPQVSGYVAALAATNAQLVKAGDLLARIDQRPFVLEVEKARSALQSATQAVGASRATWRAGPERRGTPALGGFRGTRHEPFGPGPGVFGTGCCDRA